MPKPKKQTKLKKQDKIEELFGGTEEETPTQEVAPEVAPEPEPQPEPEAPPTEPEALPEIQITTEEKPQPEKKGISPFFKTEEDFLNLLHSIQDFFKSNISYKRYSVYLPRNEFMASYIFYGSRTNIVGVFRSTRAIIHQASLKKILVSTFPEYEKYFKGE